MAKTKTKKPSAKKTSAKKPSAKKPSARKPAPKKPDAPALQGPHAELLAFALSLPETYPDHPWGEIVVKVAKKVFVFLGRPEEPSANFSWGAPPPGSRSALAHPPVLGRARASAPIGFSVKLPISGEDVLELPFAEPTGYGLGKSGWVTVRFPPNEEPPMDELCQWIEESYRAVAPKKLVARLGP